MGELTAVFVLQHTHVLSDGEEDVKLIGCYSSKDLASKAIERLRRMPGFAESTKGFTIDRYVIDTDHWIEGFVTS